MLQSTLKLSACVADWHAWRVRSTSACHTVMRVVCRCRVGRGCFVGYLSCHDLFVSLVAVLWVLSVRFHLCPTLLLLSTPAESTKGLSRLLLTLKTHMLCPAAPAPAPSKSMQLGLTGGKAVPSVKLRHPASRHGSSKVTTNCLQCAAQQLFKLPRLQVCQPQVRPCSACSTPA
jgi:hypothetical protein